MNSERKCPLCERADSRWLSTTNEWEHYCPHCDLRFNNAGEIRPGDVKITLVMAERPE